LDAQEATNRFYAEVWPHAATVLRTAQFLTRDAAEAEDLAQETMIKAFRGLDRYRAGTDVKAWLMAILRNTRIDRLRSAAASKENLSLEGMPGDPEAPPSNETRDEEQVWRNPEEMMQGFADRQVIAAMRTLPEEIRWTLLLVDVEGLEHAEAANVLDVPVGTVKSRAHRGRAMLRVALVPVAREMRLIR
jgi:RNA polymerase sigma-70 factor (ECF subfamily)